nr:hypothetical protein GCM10025699_71300 [Microbacterium flavescens]
MVDPTLARIERPRWTRWALLTSGLYVLLVAWAEPFFVRYPRGSLAPRGLAGRRCGLAPPGGSKAAWVTILSAIISASAQIAWLVTAWYPAWAVALGVALVVAFSCFAGFWKLSRTHRRALGQERASVSTRSLLTILRSVVSTLLVVIAAVTSAVVLLVAAAPAAVAIPIQAAAGQTPSFQPRGPEGAVSVTANGDGLTSDVRYGDEYPSSFLDIYIADDDASVKRPTYIYIHGGGWIGGTKSDGDPNAPGGGFAVTTDPVLDGGFNFVSLDYGLAPTVKYPTQVKQVSQAVSFLQQNAEQYGLNMSDVVIGGGSAGGQLAGQFANIQTNPTYAASIGVEPVIGDALRAVMLDSPALELEKTGETQTPQPVKDLIFGLSARSYVGTSAALIEEASVTNHVTADFPATFIADGNTGTFPDQAENLHERLDQLGVTNAVDVPPASSAILGHGYMAMPGKWTDTYNEKKLAFLSALGL